ncbi:MAG TPA: hypothetical protein VJU02_00380 [Nitrospiraceae bacterium]|nr:hypothetical protein [Nitrospiraceae bacterium]
MAVFEGLEVVLAGVLAGAGVAEGAGVVGLAAVVLSAVLGVASFFSPVVGAGASSPGDGFSLSE